MNYQQKKADPVGIGLLKEGDDAFSTLTAFPLGQAYYKRPIMCSYLYRRETGQKVTKFSKIFSNLIQSADSSVKKMAFWAGPLVASATFY